MTRRRSPRRSVESQSTPASAPQPHIRETGKADLTGGLYTTRPLPTGLEGVPPAILGAWRDTQIAGPPKIDGPDFLSRRQLGELWTASRQVVQERLANLMREGRVEIGRRRTVRSDGSPTWIPVYRLKEAE